MAHTRPKIFETKGRILISLFLAILIGLNGCTNKSSFEDIGKYKDYTHEQLLDLAKKNDCEAITQLGRNALQSGDSIEAYQWFMKAAEEGYAVAESNIGVCYYEGIGVDVNLSEAFKWVMKAAKHGFAQAQENIGINYFSGENVEKNPEEAFKWFMKAAKQDYPYSQHMIAFCYNYGIGTKEDKAEAQKWVKKIAKEYHKSEESVYTNLKSFYDFFYGKEDNEVVAVEEVDVIVEDTLAGDTEVKNEYKNPSKWKYETKTNAMTDQVGYTATLLSNESHDGARLELTIAYVNNGRPSMVEMCFNPVELINFKTNDSNEIYTIKYRFD